jgi:hypothetical protein
VKRISAGNKRNIWSFRDASARLSTAGMESKTWIPSYWIPSNTMTGSQCNKKADHFKIGFGTPEKRGSPATQSDEE